MTKLHYELPKRGNIVGYLVIGSLLLFFFLLPLLWHVCIAAKMEKKAAPVETVRIVHHVPQIQPAARKEAKPVVKVPSCTERGYGNYSTPWHPCGQPDAEMMRLFY